MRSKRVEEGEAEERERERGGEREGEEGEEERGKKRRVEPWHAKVDVPLFRTRKSWSSSISLSPLLILLNMVSVLVVMS